MNKRHGRQKPYTSTGIMRLPCVRCGDPAYRQMSICADESLWRPLCKRCDIGLNKLVLDFLRDPDANKKMTAYISDQAAELLAKPRNQYAITYEACNYEKIKYPEPPPPPSIRYVREGVDPKPSIVERIMDYVINTFGPNKKSTTKQNIKNITQTQHNAAKKPPCSRTTLEPNID